MSKTLKTIQFMMLINLITVSMPLAMEAGQAQQPMAADVSDADKDLLINELQELVGNDRSLNRDSIKIGNLDLGWSLAGKTDDEKKAILQKISEMTWLQELYLSHNQLTEVPAELVNLANLQKLYLSVNSLTEVPAELGRLTNLQELYLSVNRLTEVPAELGRLTNLQRLDLSHNQLTEVPAELGRLTNLQRLSLSRNQLTEVPAELGRLTNLQRLFLNYNRLTEVPAELGRLTNLQRLDLSHNRLTSVPASISQIRTLTLLTLENLPNLLEHGESPDQWGRQELRTHFGNRVDGLSQPKPQVAMPQDTTEDQVEKALNAQLYHINLPVFTGNRLPEITVEHVFTGDEILESLTKILTSLNFTDPNKPAYMEYETIANDFASDARASSLSNIDKVWEFLVPRLTGYFRTLYMMPLEPKDVRGWAMYEDKIRQTQKVLSFILQKIEAMNDPETKMALFYQLVNGLLHCPTGQSEGINTVAFALLEGQAVGDSFAERIKRLLALKKNDWFTTTILARAVENNQNVHLISYYRGQLQGTLGLLSPLNYTEHIGTFGFDPFSRNPANVLQVYFELVKPDSLVTWVMDKMQNQEDLELVMAQGAAEENKPESGLSDEQKDDLKKLNESMGLIREWLATYKKLNDDNNTQPENQYMEKLQQIEAQLVQNLGLTDELKDRDINEKYDHINRLPLKRKAIENKAKKTGTKPLNGKFWKDFVVKQGLVAPEAIIDDKGRHIADKQLPQGWWTPWFTADPQAENAKFTPDGWVKMIQFIKAKIKSNKQFRPFATSDAIAYMRDNQLIDASNETWWNGLMTADPLTDEAARLTRDGVKKILIHMGFLIDKHKVS